jgi:hypothetical protein
MWQNRQSRRCSVVWKAYLEGQEVVQEAEVETPRLLGKMLVEEGEIPHPERTLSWLYGVEAVEEAPPRSLAPLLQLILLLLRVHLQVDNKARTSQAAAGQRPL